MAVVRTCEALGTSPRAGTFHADYTKVDALLASIEQQVRESFLSGDVLAVDRDVSPVLDHVGNWSIATAREAAWTNAMVLWHLRDAGPVRDAFVDTLAGSVALASATLLTPVLP